MIWTSGLATRVINRSTGKGFSVFSFRHINRWLLISDCRYFCFAGSLLQTRENMYAIANRPQSELPCCCWTRWTFTSRDFWFPYSALSCSCRSFLSTVVVAVVDLYTRPIVGGNKPVVSSYKVYLNAARWQMG